MEKHRIKVLIDGIIILFLLLFIVGCKPAIEGTPINPKVTQDEAIPAGNSQNNQTFYYLFLLQRREDNVQHPDKLLATKDIATIERKISGTLKGSGFNDSIVKYFIGIARNQYFLVALPYNLINPDGINNPRDELYPKPVESIKKVMFSSEPELVIIKADFPWTPEFINTDMESFIQNSNYHYHLTLLDKQNNALFYIIKATTRSQLENHLSNIIGAKFKKRKDYALDRFGDQSIYD